MDKIEKHHNQHASTVETNWKILDSPIFLTEFQPAILNDYFWWWYL